MEAGLCVVMLGLVSLAHSWLGLFLISGGFWHVATQPFDALMRAFTWSGEAILGYSLSTLSLCSFTAAVLAWYNDTAYPSEMCGPTGPEASQAQTFTFLLRDQHFGLCVVMLGLVSLALPMIDKTALDKWTGKTLSTGVVISSIWLIPVIWLF